MEVIAILLFITGLCIGSFLNVLIDRLPVEETILGRSHCDHCKKQLSWLELIPLLSFLVQNGKCRNCNKKLSWQYPLIELVTGAVFLLVWFLPPREFLTTVYPNLQFALDPQMDWTIFGIVVRSILIIMASAIIVMTVTDLKVFIIPHWMQLIFGLCALSLFFIGHIDRELIIYRIGSGVVTFLPFLFLFQITKGKGLGFADVILAANMGLFMGIQYAFASFYISFMTGAIVGAFLMLLRKRGLKSKIPFGPFMIFAMLLVIFYFEPVRRLVYYYWAF